MKYCEFCGHQLPDYAAFCERCGAQQPVMQQHVQPSYAVHTAEPAASPEEEYRLLEQMKKLLRAEHLAWKIAAIVNTCLIGLSVLGLIVLLASGFSFTKFFESIYDYSEDFGGSYDFSVSLNSFAFSIPGVIIGFIMAAKTKRYYQCIHTYPAAAINRCGSVGSIVMGALFNEVALIFIIINFVRCKSNKKLLDQILQRSYRSF